MADGAVGRRGGPLLGDDVDLEFAVLFGGGVELEEAVVLSRIFVLADGVGDEVGVAAAYAGDVKWAIFEHGFFAGQIVGRIVRPKFAQPRLAFIDDVRAAHRFLDRFVVGAQEGDVRRQRDSVGIFGGDEAEHAIGIVRHRHDAARGAFADLGGVPAAQRRVVLVVGVMQRQFDVGVVAFE